MMMMRMMNYNEDVCHFLMMMSPSLTLICLTLSDDDDDASDFHPLMTMMMFLGNLKIDISSVSYVRNVY